MLIRIVKILLSSLLLIGLLLPINNAFSENLRLPILSGVGGNFSAIDGNGKKIELSNYQGKVILLAFGYTNCADVCPFTLGYLKQLYKNLTPEEQKEVDIIFVTIDPKYDTPEHLKSFVEFFNKDFIALSGTQEQIDYIVSLYQAEYSDLSKGSKVTTKTIRRTTPQKTLDQNEKASLFSHTVAIYLLDKKGRTRSLEYTGTPKDEFTQKIRSLINEK